MTSFIFDDKVNAAGTHVLIVGVGHYPHLQGGGDPLQTPLEGLPQLGGTAAAAKRVGQWFLESFRNEARPLRSLALLVSAPTVETLTWRSTPSGRSLTDVRLDVRPAEDPRENDAIARADYASLVEAATRWYERGDESAENQLIFLFSGHGLGDKALVSLLMRDFAVRPGPAGGLTGMLDFTRFRLAMQRCRARRQLWFVDACRKRSKTLDNAGGYLGESPIRPGPGGPTEPCNNPVFHSTLAGSEAYALPGTTLFTDALLAAFRGGGSQDLRGNRVWHVTPNALHQGLEIPLRRAAKKYGVLQIAPVDSLSVEYPIHTLPGNPLVPVFLECSPEEATGEAQLSYQRVGGPEGEGSSRPPKDGAWELELDVGTYKIEASFSVPTVWSTASEEIDVRPPTKEISLEVRNGGV